MIVSLLWLFVRVPWFGLQCVIEVVADHTHLFYFNNTDQNAPRVVPRHARPISLNKNLNISETGQIPISNSYTEVLKRSTTC